MRDKASDRLLRRLQDDIEAGTLSPGDRIDEQMLATRFAVSRTPAREAILQLAAAGAVRMVPRRGAIISSVSPSLAIGMVEVLTALEAEAAGLAARRMRPVQRQRLAALHKQAEAVAKQRDSDAYIASNAEFHAVIFEGACNACLTEQITVLRRRMRFYHRASLTQGARLKASWVEHGRVMEAIEAGDEALAQLAMRQHILLGGKVFTDMVASLTAEAAA